MSKIIIKQIKSSIKKSKKQKMTLKALGLKKINQIVKHNADLSILGMIEVVNHLVNVKNENIK